MEGKDSERRAAPEARRIRESTKINLKGVDRIDFSPRLQGPCVS